MLSFIKGGGWILLLVLAAAGWVGRQIQLAGDRREAQLLADAAKVEFLALVDSVEVWKARKAASDSARNVLATELAAERVTGRADSIRAAQELVGTRSLLAKARRSIDSLTLTDVEEIIAGVDALEDANKSCNASLGTCGELVKAADARIWTLEAEQRRILEVTRQQSFTIDRLQNIGTPPVGTWGYVGWALAAIGAVVAIVQ